MKRRVAIVFGGNSVEHEISILSAIQANYAVDRNRYDVMNIYLTKDSEFWVGPKFGELATFKKDRFKHYIVTFFRRRNKIFLKGHRYLPFKYSRPIDVIIPVVHGNNVEDGSLAGYFNILNMPYASSPVFTAALFQNKFATKIFLDSSRINVVPYHYFHLKQYKTDIFSIIETCDTLGFPVIIKPASLGSSIGIKVAGNRNELIKALNYVVKFDDEVIIEKKLTDFKELNQAILKQGDNYIYSHIEEVRTSSNYLTFHDKYLPKNSKREIPAVIANELRDIINDCSKKIAVLFQPQGVIRVDYLYDNVAGTLYVNEINSIPGSLGFYLFEDIVPFPDIVDTLICEALRNKYDRGLKLTSFKTNVLHSDKQLKK